MLGAKSPILMNAIFIDFTDKTALLYSLTYPLCKI